MSNTTTLLDRRAGLGGTDIGVLFGVNRYKTLTRLWLEKTGRFPQQVNDWEGLEWGRLLEDPVARKYSKLTGRRLQKFKAPVVHPTHRFLIGNPDRRQWDRQRPRAERSGIAEVKCAIFSKLKEWSHDGIPAQYYLQLQHYLELTGCAWGSFVVLFGGNKLVHFDVPRDEHLIRLIIEKAGAFWEYVQSDTMPPVPLTEQVNKELAELFPHPTQTEPLVLDTPEAIGRARAIVRLDAQIKLKTKALAEHQAWFKVLMADHVKATVPGIASLTWTPYERAAYTVAAGKSRRFTCQPLEAEIDLTDDDAPDSAPVYTVGARQIELD